MTLPIFRQIRQKRRYRGRGVYTLSDTDLPNYVFKDRTSLRTKVVRNPKIDDKPITDVMKPTDHIRPVKFETSEDLNIDIDKNFIEGLDGCRTRPNKELAWRYVQNNIKNLLSKKQITFKPSTISWDGSTELDGKNIYSDIKYLGIITPHTPRGSRLYKALKEGWVMMSKNQSNKLRKKDGFGIDPIVYAYVILQHKDKTMEHKIFRLRDKLIDPTPIDQEFSREALMTPPPKKQRVIP